MPKIEESVILITGADGGIGKALVKELMINLENFIIHNEAINLN